MVGSDKSGVRAALRLAVSRIAALRAEQFRLIEAVEHLAVCKIDDLKLATLIDCAFDGRDELTADEAEVALLAVAVPDGLGS